MRHTHTDWWQSTSKMNQNKYEKKAPALNARSVCEHGEFRICISARMWMCTCATHENDLWLQLYQYCLLNIKQCKWRNHEMHTAYDRIILTQIPMQSLVAIAKTTESFRSFIFTWIVACKGIALICWSNWCLYRIYWTLVPTAVFTLITPPPPSISVWLLWFYRNVRV